MEGEFLDEDNGATLYCDTCKQQVRSNEAHRCQGFEAVPLCDPRLMECLRKVEGFIECESDRLLAGHPELTLCQTFHFQEMKRTFDDAEFALRNPDPPKVEEPGDIVDDLRDLHKALVEEVDFSRGFHADTVSRAIKALGGDLPESEVEEFTLIVHLDFKLKGRADTEDFLSEMDYTFKADPDQGTMVKYEIISWQRR